MPYMGYLFRPTRHCDTQSCFLKQPVTAVSVTGDPVTLPVPVNGAKSDRLPEDFDR